MSAASKVKRILDDEHQKAFADMFDAVCERHGRWSVFEGFVLMAAIAISNRVDGSHYEEREARYMRKVEEYSKQELDIFPHMLAELTLSLQRNPEQDFMGKLFMNLDLGNDKKGQFFTPYDVSRMMAQVGIDEPDVLESRVQKSGFVSVSDPSCGAGGMPGYVVIDNTLTTPALSLDNRYLIPKPGPNVWYTPMYFAEIWHYRRLWAELDMMFSGARREENA